MDTIDAVLTIPAFILSILSCICNLYVLQATIKYQRRFKPENGNRSVYNNDYVVVHLISWLSMIDIIWITIYAINYIPTIFDIKFYNEKACTILGLMLQFAEFINVSWHALIVSEFAYLLILGSDFKSHSKLYKCGTICCRPPFNCQCKKYLQNRKLFCGIKIFIIVLSGIIAFIPLFVPQVDSYGEFYNYVVYDKEKNKNSNHGNYIPDYLWGYDAQCWLKGDLRLMYYGVGVMVTLCYLFLLFITLRRYNETKSYTKAYGYFVVRLLPWIVVYSMIRIFPTISRLWTAIARIENSTPLWLVVAHNVSLTSFGIANFVVWRLNVRAHVSVHLRRPLANKDEFNDRNKRKKANTKKKKFSSPRKKKTSNNKLIQLKHMKNNKKMTAGKDRLNINDGDGVGANIPAFSYNYSNESEYSIHDLADPRKQSRKTKIRLGTIDTNEIENNINDSIARSKFRGFTMGSEITATPGNDDIKRASTQNLISSPETTFRFNNGESTTRDVNQAFMFGLENQNHNNYNYNKSNNLSPHDHHLRPHQYNASSDSENEKAIIEDDGNNDNHHANHHDNHQDNDNDNYNDANLPLLSPLVKVADGESVLAMGNGMDSDTARLSTTTNTNDPPVIRRTITPFDKEQEEP